MDSGNQREPSAASPRIALALAAAAFVVAALANEWVVRALLGRAVKTDARCLLAAIDAAALLAGIALVRWRNRFRLRHLVFAAVPVLAVLVLAEIGARVFVRVRARGLVEPCELTGWRPRANSTFDGVVRGYGRVRFNIGRDGFRAWPDSPTTATMRVWAIGDSYTHGHTVSDGQMYFDQLGRRFPQLEVFAFGGIGFGTLQEWLIFDRYFDDIRPDVVIWQFSSNDIINNAYRLDSMSALQNNHVVRPYFEEGRVVFLYPKQRDNPAWLLARYSYLLRLVDELRDQNRGISRWSIEHDLADGHPLLEEGMATARELMSLVRRRAGSIPIVAFCSDTAPWAGTAIRRACEANGVLYADVVQEKLSEARDRGVQIVGEKIGSFQDLHWNAEGQRIVGDALADYLRDRGIVK